jgi:hypothetical protein
MKSEKATVTHTTIINHMLVGAVRKRECRQCFQTLMILEGSRKVEMMKIVIQELMEALLRSDHRSSQYIS